LFEVPFIPKRGDQYSSAESMRGKEQSKKMERAVFLNIIAPKKNDKKTKKF
jgi:hypothetical protein